MGEDVRPVILNIGCGFRKIDEAINVDAFSNCEPDIQWDLNKMPWPWRDNSVDGIYASHIMEHLTDWFAAFVECARILKPGGTLEIRVPDHTSTQDMGYIDHHHILTRYSFHMILRNPQRGANAWAVAQNVIPLVMTQYIKIPKLEYVRWWFPKGLLRFCCDHLVNFCHEQQFTFIKISDRGNENGRI